MALNDPPYFRDSSGPSMSPLAWLFAGALPLGDWGGVRVRLHASVVLTVFLVPVVFSPSLGVVSALLLAYSIFVMSIVHEFGHWVAARSLGVVRRELLVSPLGAPVSPERIEPPRVVAWTALGGPVANFVACSSAGGLLWVLAPSSMLWDPLGSGVIRKSIGLNFGELALWWLFVAGYAMLLINLLPIYPLDGGHVLHALMRPRYGFVNALRFTCLLGMVGSIALIIGGAVSRHRILIVVAAGCALSCLLQVRAITSSTREEVGDEIDYSTAYEKAVVPKRRRISMRAIRRARKAAMELRLEQERLDAILAKVSKHTLASLTWKERRTLRNATERRRRMDL